MPARSPSAVVRNSEPKAGLQTTEFWLTAVVVICATVLCALGKLDATAWTGATGATSAGYAISRGLAKR